MFERLIAKIVSTLENHGISYMIIGGQAVLLYGAPRLTKDIDITLDTGIDNLPLVVNAVSDMNLRIIPEGYEEFVRRTFVLPARDGETGIRVDFIFSFTPYEHQAISRTKIVEIGGVKARFASIEDIVIHKIFSGRPRDMEDIRSMLIKHPEVDRSYIRKWLREFDRTFEGKGFLELVEKMMKEAF